MEKKSDFTIALVGNPGVGKSSLFAKLTGCGGNIGKTMEKREGYLDFKRKNIRIVDLPGSYSLNAYTKEEGVASSFVLFEKPDVVVQIIDAQNLERNLLMTARLMEMDVSLVIAINFLNLAQDRGIFIDIKKLAELLGVSVVAVNINQKKGIDELLDVVMKAKSRENGKRIDYGMEVEEELAKIGKFVSCDRELPEGKILWLSLGILEGDEWAKDFLSKKDYFSSLWKMREESVAHLEEIFGEDLNTIMTRIRYGFIGGLVRECIAKSFVSDKKNISDRLDRIALDKFLGIPLFLFVIVTVFQSAFKISQPFSNLIEIFFSFLKGFTVSLLQWAGFSSWTISLVTDGIISGAGNVLVFIPVLGILFALIAILEDSGYMARIAYVMDRFMHKFGLHGKAFIPMILGFGCNVPGVMAARMLESRQDRFLAILINPFMSCGSRLPTYILFAGIFFPGHQGEIILSLYALGMLTAVSVGFIFRKFIFKELYSPFVIELPSYRFPNMRGVLVHAGGRVGVFIKNAGTVIVAFSVLVWFLANMPAGTAYGLEESYASIFGGIVSTLFAPLGFGFWQAAVALIFGVAGKEIIVGTFGTLYGSGDASVFNLSSALGADFTALSSYAFMVFVLLYTPCVATLATIKRETNSWKWTLFSATYSFVIAYLAAFAIYNGGRLLCLN